MLIRIITSASASAVYVFLVVYVCYQVLCRGGRV